jgi:CheY-like chemotaxis protein
MCSCDPKKRCGHHVQHHSHRSPHFITNRDINYVKRPLTEPDFRSSVNNFFTQICHFIEKDETKTKATSGIGVGMNVLIVESTGVQAKRWSDYLGEICKELTSAKNRVEAVEALRVQRYNAIVLDLSLAEGTALSIADYAAYRQPWARVLFVTRDASYEGGWLFQNYANARGVTSATVPPQDLAAMVDYYAKCA